MGTRCAVDTGGDRPDEEGDEIIDTVLLGETAAKCMEYMDESEHLDGGHIVAVAIVVVAENASESQTFTRTFSSETMYYKQVGLMQAGIECVRDGFRQAAPGELDDEEDDDD